MNKKRQDRLFTILTAIQCNESCTIEELAALTGTSRRSLFRDLKVLQELGLRIEWDSYNKRYAFGGYRFSSQKSLTEQQAFMICLAVSKYEAHTTGHALISLQEAAEQLCETFDEKITAVCHKYKSRILFSSCPYSYEQTSDKILLALLSAIDRKRVIQITLQNSEDEPSVEMVEVCPFYLIEDRHQWYLGVKLCDNEECRIIAIHDILSFRVLDRGFTVTNSSLPQRVSRKWSMEDEGEMYSVKVRFCSSISRRVSGICWHSSQKHHVLEDGSAVLAFEVEGLDGIESWILGFGPDAEVIEPAVLRERIRARLAQMQKIYALKRPSIARRDG